jgi:hypothetical protein
MDLSLVIFHPVDATLYVVPFLRSLGFFIGDKSIRANIITLKKTKLHARAFAGNSSLLPQRTKLRSNSLVGILSIAPEVPLKEGQSFFGSPPVLMPVRQSPIQNHPDHLLYTPRWTQQTLRLFIEAMRIFLPRAILIFGLGFGVQLLYLGIESLGVWTVFLLPLFYLFRKLPNMMNF